MTVATAFNEALYAQLCRYIDVLGAPVLAIHGIVDGKCTCGKPTCTKNGGKHPHPKFCPSGVKDATLDKTILRRWVASKEPLNWAIATGKPLPSGGYLVALDIDPRNGGDDNLAEMEQEHGKLPETPLQLTGGAGYHYILSVPTKPSGTVVAPGIDLKGDGGYLMVEPSSHMSGGSYVWEISTGLEVAVASAPDWVVYAKQKKPRPLWTGAKARESIIGAAFEAAGWLGLEISEGRFNVHCPWAHKHTDNRGRGSDSSTVILPPTAESTHGGFKCQHEHCAQRTWEDVMAALPVDAAKAARSRFRNVNDEQILATGSPDSGSNTRVLTAGLTPQQMAQMREHLEWRQSKTGTWSLKRDFINIVGVLNHDPRWEDVLSYDSFSNQILVNREPPWHQEDRSTGLEHSYPRQWADEDDLRLRLWLGRMWGLDFDPTTVHAGVMIVAQSHAVHPVRQYLRSLEWDGVPRLEKWLENYCGAEPDAYADRVGTWWMISAIARVMDPGCEAHHVLILEGEQGIGKSTAFKILAGKWFCDSGINIGDKDAYQIIRGRWIVELAELDSLSRADSARAKAFFTSPSDTYRPSYGRSVVTVPRQCVFAGTVNHAEYLVDSTGNRRYWPVRCTAINYSGLAKDRDMLWAEAFKLYESGAKWYPTTQDEKTMCAIEASQREFSDEWEAKLSHFANGPEAKLEIKTFHSLSIGTLLEKGLLIPPGVWKTSEMTRVSRCMQRLGWIRVRSIRDGVKMWAFNKGAAK